MDELQSILQSYRSKRADTNAQDADTLHDRESFGHSLIPDLFFDKVLVHIKLSRIEILIFMYIYRRVWEKPNLYKAHGISPILSYTEMASNMNVELEDIYLGLKNLENLGLLETIRAGQYFVRRYFTKDFDFAAHQTYDDFDV